MKKRILAIDDDPVIRDIFSTFLEKHNFEVLTASRGRNALNILNETSCDLIFLDLKMPEMDGVETLREIRKKDKDTPVYILTGFECEYAQSLIALRDDSILFEIMTKPVRLDQLLSVVNNVLEMQQDKIPSGKICLFKIGNKPELEEAFNNLRIYFDGKFNINFEFQIVDCLENPQLAIDAGIIATPTIVKMSPPPEARVVGSIADYQKMSAYLGIF